MTPVNQHGSSPKGGTPQRNGFRQRLNQSNKNKRNSSGTRTPRRSTRYEGAEPSLGNHVYALGYTQHEAFNRTTKEIGEHVGRTYKNGGDMKRTIDAMEKVNIRQPEDLPSNPPPTATQKRIWEKEVDEFTKRREILNRNLENFYSLLWGSANPP